MSLSAPRFRLGRRSYTVDLPHLGFASAIAAWSAWYCRDAWLARADVENMILILPAGIAAMLLYAVVAIGCFKTEAPAERAHTSGTGVQIAVTMALLAAFAIGAPLIGFDAAGFAYLFAMLFFLGERRILVLLLIPAVFCAVVIFCFGTLLDTPLPLLFTGDRL